MLTGKLPLHVYKANQETEPLLISEVQAKDKVWQNHTNYFSVLWVQEGEGRLETDFSKTSFGPGQVFCFNIYQAFALQPHSPTRAQLLLFHPNFFCIETYQHEVGCNGVLFNQVYNAQPIAVEPETAIELAQLLKNMQAEMKTGELATGELVFSYLKIFLVKLTRLKTAQTPGCNPKFQIPAVLTQLETLINENFSKHHQPSFYADALHLPLKTLGSLCRKHFHKSLSMLISEKVLLRAKWELLHTDTQVKGVAASLGFKDEHYFSRFFKKHIGLSPTHFREAEWEMRRGYLSIP
ncbi:AraC family transcriptional regulator [Adhaeribacter soli]|uniref:Helix-turn-helix domain-containing protein n=1 Tax=Adhaeribacter soli TaxID=2607655 RepID=A0A5N1IZK3_9BACT|nr:AraC family transcriptional regulator [Adhaeribacter soli]KAA9338896.1 helix-turn-helix domain-containing protein [Adhaeribacter soli]